MSTASIPRPARWLLALMRSALTASLTSVAFLLFACGGGGDSGGVGAAPPQQGVIIGSAGGIASSKDGKAFVTIPAGALAADELITVEPVASPPAGAIAAYEFGPDGLQFARAVSLTIAYSEASIPAGVTEANLRLRTFQNGQWVATAAPDNSAVDTAQCRIAGLRGAVVQAHHQRVPAHVGRNLMVGG